MKTLRILIAFEDSDSIQFVTNQFHSAEQVQGFFLTPPPWVFQTSEGPVVVTKRGGAAVYIQELIGSRTIETTKIHLEDAMTEEALAQEEEARILAGKPTEDPSLPMGGIPNMAVPPTLSEPYSPPIGVTPAPANLQFRSFRDEFLSLQLTGEGWEKNIVEKQKAYVSHLEETYRVLNERDQDVQEFRDKIVGK